MRIDVGRIIDQLDETNRFWLDITTLTNYSYFMMNRIFKAEEIKAVRAAACARLILCAENAWKGGLMSRYYSCPS